MNLTLSRRGLIAAAAASGLVPSFLRRASAAPAAPRGDVLRVAHLTDMHVQPELRAGEGFAACLDHMGATFKADLILTGGDHVFDCFATDEARTATQWELYRSTLKKHATAPVQACIGNHDIWGWNKGASKTTGNEPTWGKKRAVAELGMPARYHSFDQGGWRFIALDTVQTDPNDANGYTAGVDDEQFDWLSGELSRTPSAMPVLVYSHIPIMHAAGGLFNRTVKKTTHSLGASLVCLDNLRLVHLFSKHPNVKLCLSGHVHNVERIDFQGVSYVCGGAVSGAWWRGNKPDEKPHVARAVEGYCTFELRADGTFAQGYETYGWKA
ncbi:MAG: 3,5-cyclic adenosine monophosphate phosphodiesterase CpdA [Planctomycetota bacterium]|jgi:hypothetical protein